MGDAWGSRRVITRIVLWWSVFTALTGWVAHSYVMGNWVITPFISAFWLLLLVRFLFGCGEAGAYPNLARITGAWFPFRERAFTQGAVWMSARLGGAIAPFLIGRLTENLGWRMAFWIFGAIGIVWGLGFFTWFRDTPEEKPDCNEAERWLIRAGPYSWKKDEASAGHAWPPWSAIFLNPSILALCLCGAAVSFSWYFLPTWQPKFLEDQFQIPYSESEIITGLPFLFGAVGALLGGRCSDWLIERTGSRRWGRSLLGFVCFSLAGSLVFAAGWVREAWQAVTLFCLASFINDMAIPPIWAAAADIGGRFAGTVSGLMNMVGGFGAIITPIMIPSMRAQGHSWQTIFVILALVWFLAAAAWLFIDASKPIQGKESHSGDEAPPREKEGGPSSDANRAAYRPSENIQAPFTHPPPTQAD
jgi:MFS family permease